jgi:hypothetical protein
MRTPLPDDVPFRKNMTALPSMPPSASTDYFDE